MKTTYTLFSTLCLLSLATTVLPGCTQQSGQNAKVQEINQQGQNLSQNRESAGITTRNDVMWQINQIKGVQHTTVLLHNGNAYVGLTEIGPEHTPDAAMRSGDNWTGMPYGTQRQPNSARGLTVQQQLAEGIPNGNSHEGPYSTLTGNLSPEVIQSTIKTVTQMVPGVRNVYITGNHDVVQKLEGYRFFINRGGNMNPHMGDFNSFINNVFHSQPPAQLQWPTSPSGKASTKAGTVGQTKGPSPTYRTTIPGTGDTNRSKSSNDMIGSGTTEHTGNQDVDGMGTSGAGMPMGNMSPPTHSYRTSTPGTGDTNRSKSSNDMIGSGTTEHTGNQDVEGMGTGNTGSPMYRTHTPGTGTSGLGPKGNGMYSTGVSR